MKVHPLVLTIVTLWLVEDSRATRLRGTTSSQLPTSGLGPVGYGMSPPSEAPGGVPAVKNMQSFQNIDNLLGQRNIAEGISKTLLEKLSNAGLEEVGPELTEEDAYRAVKDMSHNDPFNV